MRRFRHVFGKGEDPFNINLLSAGVAELQFSKRKLLTDRVPEVTGSIQRQANRFT